jgi:hypothetical protein
MYWTGKSVVVVGIFFVALYSAFLLFFSLVRALIFRKASRGVQIYGPISLIGALSVAGLIAVFGHFILSPVVAMMFGIPFVVAAFHFDSWMSRKLISGEKIVG